MLLSVSQVRKLFANEIVLEDASFRLERREKVALVGRNGAGKTTLLKILTGQYELDAGNVMWERGASVGYLSQVSIEDSDRTVLEHATEARSHLVEMQNRLHELEQILEHSPTDEDLEEYSLLQGHFIEQGGYSVESDLRVVLKRLGFEEDEFEKPVSALSGGEKTRLCLAKLLLEEPDLLILDEPTNHLDLDAVEWLEGWLRGYGGAVLVVSHDRVFLQNVVTRVIEIRNGKTRSFPGSFDKYRELARAEDELQASLAAKQQEEMAKLDEFVRRFMNSQRTAQARGRLKQLEKLKANAIEAPSKEKNIKLDFSAAKRSGDIVLDCRGLSMAFGDQKLFQNLDWTVRWGERWGVIGSNGAGKSTLIKVALGKLEPVSGTRRVGSNVELGWFTQDADFLDPNDSPLEAFCGATGFEFGPARSALGRFLISGDDSMRPIRTLSGGERVKVALAILTALRPNVLILDEPTNHLDIPSREALVDVLSEYNGTLILVSHDRWLLEKATQQTLDLRTTGHIVYPGSFGEYRASRNRPATSPTPAQPSKQGVKAAPVPSVPTLTPRELSKEISKTNKGIEDTEAEISRLEKEMEALERVMARPTPGDDLLAMSTRHGELQGAIENALNQWTNLGERLEELKAMQGASPEVGVSFRPVD